MGSRTLVADYWVEIDGLSRERWSKVLEGFEDASLYQTWDYGAVRWGEKNLSHMVLRREGRIVSAAQCRIIRFPLVKKGVAYTFYGPMSRVRGQLRDIAAFRLGLRAIIDEYVHKRGFFLRVRPWGFEERDEDLRTALMKEGFRRSTGIHRNKKRTVLIDLKPSEEELRRRLQKGWQRNLKRAENENLQIIESHDKRLWEPLTALHKETLDLKMFKPGSSIDEFREIQRRLPPDHKMRVTLCKKGGAFVSAAVCCAIGDTAIGLLSASGPSGRKVRAFYLLQWDEILWAKRTGKTHLDLGGINPHTNPGVYHFKAGIGGQEVSLLGVYDKCRNPLFYRAVVGYEYMLRLRDRLLERYGSKRPRPGSRP